MSWREKYLKRHTERFESMKPYIRQHDSIADLGMGAGGYYYQENIKNVIGVDLDGVLLKRARGLNPNIETIKGDILKIELPLKSFSLVVLSQIIEHFKDYESLIKKAKSICKDDGYFLIGLPIDCPNVVHFFPKWTEEDVRNLAKKFGKIIDIKKSNEFWLLYIKNK